MSLRADDERFAELVMPYRRELHVHCYRMLGSVTYADDLLQETLLAAWQSIDRFAGHATMRTWLYRIATNRCLNAIRDGKRRPAEVPLPPFDPPDPSNLTEVNWLQPYADRWLDEAVAGDDPARHVESHETISLAFIAALQRLPPRQAAAFILVDVLDFTAGEAAVMLESSATAIKGLLQRARAALEQARDGGASAGAAARNNRSDADHQLADRFAAAFASDDIDAVTAMLTDEAWLRMPPARHEYHGPDAISRFLNAGMRSRGGRRFQLTAVGVNRHPGYLCRIDDIPLAVLAIAPTVTGIAGIHLFVDPVAAQQLQTIQIQ